MNTKIRTPGTRARAISSALVLCLMAACATIEAPTGGPADEIPPTVLSTWPDSGATGLRGFDRFEIVFSEKVEPAPAERILKFYPPLEIRKTRWKGRQRMIVELRDTLPADTVLVIEIPRGYADIHRVRSKQTLVIPLASADSFPIGSLEGLIILEDTTAAAGVVELYAVPPDSIDWKRQKPLRRSAAGEDGIFRFPWLPAPGGPWLIHVFEDANGDMRPSEGEAQRLMPGEFKIDEDEPLFNLGSMTIFLPTTPGFLLMTGRPDSTHAGALYGWSEIIAESDTGFVPTHMRSKPKGWAALSQGDTTRFPDAGPNLSRLIIFADLDGDSLLTAVADSSLADSLQWYWEPFALVDSLSIEPGLSLEIAAPVMPDTMLLCTVPPPLAQALSDSTAMEIPTPSAVDSLVVPIQNPMDEPDQTEQDEQEKP